MVGIKTNPLIFAYPKSKLRIKTYDPQKFQTDKLSKVTEEMGLTGYLWCKDYMTTN